MRNNKSKKTQIKEQIIHLRFYEDLSYNQICKKLGVSKSLVSYHCSETTRSKLRVRSLKYKKINKDIVYRLKKNKPCNECGKIYDPVQIDFHHLNPKEKLFNISDLTQIKVSPKKLIKEIEKCVPLCANCHRLIESNIRKDYWYMKRIESEIKIDNIQES